MKLGFRFKLIVIYAAVFCVLLICHTFAAPRTICNGKEFNRRVMDYLSGGDPNIKLSNTITRFERGNNPPSDPSQYVDISEDNDGSVIAYAAFSILKKRSKEGETLYWYSPGTAIMNDNAAYMFSNFVSLRSIDLTGFTYLNDLHDARYMFANCTSLRNLKFKALKDVPLNLTEVQGMFYNCQSLTNIDMSYFTTYHVDNMDEMFCNCYNLKNIYVDESRWNIESVRSFYKMFSGCQLLMSNKGRKAVDVDDDSYEKYANFGNDTQEGFIKSNSYTYESYGEDISTRVPVDDQHYIKDLPETIVNYDEEPEYDDVTNKEDGTPYVGDKSTGYNAEKEQGVTSDAYIIAQNDETFVSEMPSTESTSVISETSIIIVESATTVAESTVTNEDSISETTYILEETGIETTESDDNNDLLSDESKRVVELDEYLNNDDKGSDTVGQDLGGDNLRQNDRMANIRFLLLALGISLIVILLLVGMVIYLYKDKNDKDSNKI